MPIPEKTNQQPSNSTPTQFFGTDGIRGQVGIAPITPDFLLKLGWAVGSVINKNVANPCVVIGKDTRQSGYMVEAALQAGFLAAGVDVILLGPVPTPAVAYLTKAYFATAGVMISASHNHFTDNGVKFFTHEGYKLSGEKERQINEKLTKPLDCSINQKIGMARRYGQPLGRYIEFCKSTFDRNQTLASLNLVIDCANGANYRIAGDIFKELGAKTTVINNTPNGHNINFECGSLHLDSLKKTVRDKKADIGIAFDGDGDRVTLIDNKGRVFDGDDLLYIIACHWLERDRLKNRLVVGTQMTNTGIRNALEKKGIQFIEAQVGDAAILFALKKHHGILGAENSGHIICLNHATTGDGIIAALQVLEAVVHTSKTLKELTEKAVKTLQLKHNVAFTNKPNLNNKALNALKQKLTSELGATGRILVRASGTEPLVRILVEGENAPKMTKAVAKLTGLIKLLDNP